MYSGFCGFSVSGRGSYFPLARPFFALAIYEPLDAGAMSWRKLPNCAIFTCSYDSNKRNASRTTSLADPYFPDSTCWRTKASSSGGNETFMDTALSLN